MYRPWELGALIAVIFNFFFLYYFFMLFMLFVFFKRCFYNSLTLPLPTFHVHVLHTPISCVCLLCEYLYYVVFNPMFVGAIIQYSLFLLFFYVKKLMLFFLQLVGVVVVVGWWWVFWGGGCAKNQQFLLLLLLNMLPYILNHTT